MAITVYTYNDKVLKNVATDKWLKKYVDPYNPLGLPPGVFRIQVNTSAWQGNQTATLVQGTSNVYDVQDFLTSGDYNRSMVVKVLGANTKGITSMRLAFAACSSLTEVALFDTSSVTDMTSMFGSCISLISIPLFDTSSVTDMTSMFDTCRNVESGTLALYQQASTQAVPPVNHGDCFKNCGSNTVTGAAELAQIPSSWGGTAT